MENIAVWGGKLMRVAKVGFNRIHNMSSLIRLEICDVVVNKVINPLGVFESGRVGIFIDGLVVEGDKGWRLFVGILVVGSWEAEYEGDVWGMDWCEEWGMEWSIVEIWSSGVSRKVRL